MNKSKIVRFNSIYELTYGKNELIREPLKSGFPFKIPKNCVIAGIFADQYYQDKSKHRVSDCIISCYNTNVESAINSLKDTLDKCTKNCCNNPFSYCHGHLVLEGTRCNIFVYPKVFKDIEEILNNIIYYSNQIAFDNNEVFYTSKYSICQKEKIDLFKAKNRGGYFYGLVSLNGIIRRVNDFKQFGKDKIYRFECYEPFIVSIKSIKPKYKDLIPRVFYLYVSVLEELLDAKWDVIIFISFLRVLDRI
jgi:hypothetical protein